jgi:hypothetical protein
VPLVLDATVGGAAANSYTDAATADAYFLGRAFASSWTGAGTSAKEQALVWATSVLEREEWAGAKGSTPATAITQALAWPRRWAPTLEADAAPQAITQDFIDLSTMYYSELSIPQPIIRATCELALVILSNTADPFLADLTRVKRERVDVLETEFFDSSDRIRGLGHFPHVIRLVRHILRWNESDVQRA